MADLDDGAFIVLNALYLRKMADARTLTESSGCRDIEEVERVLAAALEDGLVLALGSQYVVTNDGRAAVLGYYAREYLETRTDPAVLQWYERFESVNERFLQLVSAWQVGGGGGDASEQQRVYDRLARVVERHVEALDAAVSWLPRYQTYADRFRRSLARVDEGQAQYVCSPTVDSLHNIWFEFHEDVLALLGRPRESVSG